MLLRLSALVGLVATAVVPATVGAASASDEPSDHGMSVKRLPRPDQKAVSSRFDPHTVLVKFKSGASAKARATALSARSAQSVSSVGGGYVKVRTTGAATDALRSLRKDPAVASASLDYLRTKTAVPNDPAYAQGFQTYLATARMPEAWNVIKDTHTQVIAVLDTGVDTAHQDLQGRTVAGYNAVTPGASYGDIDGHGTTVAGIAAANTNNGIGVAGTAWTGRIMPVRVFHLDGGDVVAADSDVSRGLHWAADHGAKVINMSLGGPDDTVVLHDAVKYATGKGAVVVVAAGNTAATSPHYPAAYPEALAVAATDESGSLTDFSTSGDWVDVAAPGFGISSTYFNLDFPLEHNWYISGGSGTSYASPIVAGIASIVRTRFPTLTVAQVMSRIKTTARDAGPRGIDPYYGYGFVDAYGALGGTRAGELASPPFDGNDTPARATPITASASTTIGASGDVDWYKYESGAAQSMQLDVAPAAYDETSPRNLDPMIAVYDADLNPLGSADSGAWGDPETLTVPVGTGTVYIAVRNFNGAADSRTYTLSVSAGTGGTATPGAQLWVKDIAPGDFSTGVAVGVHPTVTFQRDVDGASVTTTTVKLLHGYTGVAVPATVSYDGPSKTVTITPSADLQDNTPYRIVVGAVQETGGGATNGAPYSATFRTEDLAPGGVSGFDATGGYLSASLHWSLPAINDLSQVIVRRSTGGAPPASPTEGVSVYAGTGTTATASGLGAGGNYIFRAWVKDRAGKVSPLAETSLDGTRATIARSVSELTYGGAVTLAGKVTLSKTGAALPGAAMKLYARQKGSSTWRLLRTATSSSTGTFSYGYKPSFGNDFQWRWESGSATLVGTGSPITSVGLRPAVTAGLNHTTAPLGTTIAISGSVNPKHPGGLVYLQRYIGNNSWTNVTSTKLSSTSIYSFHVKPTARGSYSYRVVRPADTDELAGISPTRTVRIT